MFDAQIAFGFRLQELTGTGHDARRDIAFYERVNPSVLIGGDCVHERLRRSEATVDRYESLIERPLGEEHDALESIWWRTRGRLVRLVVMVAAAVSSNCGSDRSLQPEVPNVRKMNMTSTKLSYSLGVLAIAAASLGLFSRAGSGDVCWQPPGYTDATLSHLRTRVTAADGPSQAFRAKVRLVQDVAESVYVVTDETLCHRGAVALALFKNADTVNPHPVLLIGAGRSRFVLDDLATKGGEFMASYVADTDFVILGAMLN